MDLPVGVPVPGFVPPPHPDGAAMEGRFCRLQRLTPADAPALYAAHAEAKGDRDWAYLPYGPFPDAAAHAGWVDSVAGGSDPLFYTVHAGEPRRPMGVLSYLRIAPAAGSIEVGHIHFAPPMQRGPAATEAIWLTMAWAFAAGYRRFEWKCDALNHRSRRAAQRLGLSFEGIFRQAAVVKGRNRDTAWFAAIDAEWPALDAAFRAWLDPANFDRDGRQKVALADLTRPLLVALDPSL